MHVHEGEIVYKREKWVSCCLSLWQSAGILPLLDIIKWIYTFFCTSRSKNQENQTRNKGFRCLAFNSVCGNFPFPIKKAAMFGALRFATARAWIILYEAEHRILYSEKSLYE